MWVRWPGGNDSAVAGVVCLSAPNLEEPLSLAVDIIVSKPLVLFVNTVTKSLSLAIAIIVAIVPLTSNSASTSLVPSPSLNIELSPVS